MQSYVCEGSPMGGFGSIIIIIIIIYVIIKPTLTAQITVRNCTQMRCTMQSSAVKQEYLKLSLECKQRQGVVSESCLPR